MSEPPAPAAASPFHAGERAVQTRAQVPDTLEAMASQMIRDFMPEQHREFFAQLPFVVLGTVDAEGQPWATLLAQPPGFAHSPDPQHLIIYAVPAAADPAAANLRPGALVGLLGIEPQTRRRNRMNGRVTTLTAQSIEIEVLQSFGNCPKYIQAREAQFVAETPSAASATRATQIDAHAARMISEADTFFIASAHPASGAMPARAEGVDASHRGGKPGFVRVRGTTLTIPDFAGNRLFNTLGNLTLEPRAGLLFVDFNHGDLLYLATRAEIVWDGDELASFTGAERLLRFTVNEVLHVPGSLALRWAPVAPSPFVANTGAW